MDFINDFDQIGDLVILIFNIIAFLMAYMFDFNLQKHEEGISDIFPPMIVQFKEDFTHQKHNGLIFGHLVEKIKIIVEDKKQSAHGLIVISFKDGFYDLEEVVVVEGCGQLGCFLFGYHLEILIKDLEQDCYLLGVVDVDSVAEDGEQGADQVFILEELYAGSDESQGVLVNGS